jgi:hypothetical protein
MTTTIETTHVHGEFSYLRVDSKTYANTINMINIRGILVELYTKNMMLVLINPKDIKCTTATYYSFDLTSDGVDKQYILGMITPGAYQVIIFVEKYPYSINDTIDFLQEEVIHQYDELYTKHKELRTYTYTSSLKDHIKNNN